MYRKSTLEDCEAVYDLICGLEEKELPHGRFCDIYRAQTESDRYYCLVCEEDGKVIGALTMRFEEQLHHCELICEMLEFAIDGNYRNRGIGKEMFREACRIAESFGCAQVELASNQLRTGAHRFYLREGMNNFHFKFSMPFNADGDTSENIIGR